MAVTLSKVTSKTASVTISVGEDTITAVYFPNKVTGNMLAQLPTDGMGGLESLQGINEALITLVKSWDIYDDDAQTVMFPLDMKRLGELPTSIMGEIFEAIMKDMRPNAIAPTA